MSEAIETLFCTDGLQGAEAFAAAVARRGDGTIVAGMPPTATYFGHRISIEPAEWGYLARVAEPRSGVHLVAANASAMQALESAFNIVDQRLKHPPFDR